MSAFLLLYGDYWASGCPLYRLDTPHREAGTPIQACAVRSDIVTSHTPSYIHRLCNPVLRRVCTAYVEPISTEPLQVFSVMCNSWVLMLHPIDHEILRLAFHYTLATALCRVGTVTLYQTHYWALASSILRMAGLRNPHSQLRSFHLALGLVLCLSSQMHEKPTTTKWILASWAEKCVSNFSIYPLPLLS